MRRFEPRAWDGLTDRRIAALLYASPYGQGYNTQVSVQLPTSAGNVSLLAFAAERRAAVRHVARRPAGGRLRRAISPAHGYAAAAVDRRERRTDGRTPSDRCIIFAYQYLDAGQRHSTCSVDIRRGCTVRLFF